MLYKLLSVSKSSKAIGANIGDYIQALASSQYYPHVDGFLDRDLDLKDYDGEPCKMIMNGWYMHNPENWPPSEKIQPLFVAFHINKVAKDILLSYESLNYLRKFQPIGCRDIKTMELLQAHGIDAYFSGCMTLTLGKTFHSDDKDNTTYIVDPFYNGPINVVNALRALIEFLSHPLDISKLLGKKQLCLHFGRNVLMKFIKTALYYKEYKKVFGRDLIMNSIYICQESSYYTSKFKTDEERLEEAKRLVKAYAKARFVVTSRIHCALPCLGLETPVVYLEKTQDIEESSCRLGGLRELFNIVKVNKGVLKPDFEVSLPISSQSYHGNKTVWKELASELDKTCENFIKSV